MIHQSTNEVDAPMSLNDLPMILRISPELGIGGIIDPRSEELEFYSIRAASLRQGLYLLATFDTPPKLIIFDHRCLENMKELLRDVVVTVFTLLSVKFPGHSTRIAIAIDRPLRREEIKRLRDCNVSGVILNGKTFDHHLNQQSVKELLSQNTDYWPREAIETVAKPQREINESVSLTDRQKEVQQLLCERGLSNKSIARQLNISESTVKIHVSAILKRYGVRNRTQLALAVNNGARL